MEPKDLSSEAKSTCIDLTNEESPVKKTDESKTIEKNFSETDFGGTATEKSEISAKKINKEKDAPKTKKHKSSEGFFLKLKRFFTIKRILLFIILAAIGFGVWYFFFASTGDESEKQASFVEYTVVRGNITETIEQSGVIEPFQSHDITSRVMGEIIESNFEKGDYVNKGDVLYRIDDEEAQNNIQKAENSIEKSEHTVQKSQSAILMAQNNVERAKIAVQQAESSVEIAKNSVVRAQNNITRAENSKKRAQKNLDDVNKDIEKLKVYAPASGKIKEYNIKENDDIGAGTVAKIEDTAEKTITISFFEQDANTINVGDSVTLTSALHMESISGTVAHKFESTVESTSGGSICKNIEIELKNISTIDKDSSFSAVVHTSTGDVRSASSATVNIGEETSVRSEVSGKVKSSYVKNGDYVNEGQLLFELSSTTLERLKEDYEIALEEADISVSEYEHALKESELNLKDAEMLLNEKKLSLSESEKSLEESRLSLKDSELALEDSEISMDSTEKVLDDYSITAPISGTIIEKNSKVGDNINNATGQTVMMVVADTSKMKFTVNIDELDYSKIKLGQKAIVDADSMPGKTFEAVVTHIPDKGDSTGDGVTTYAVELTIDEPGELKSGYNVNANILITEVHDVLKIPEDALNSVNGSTATVIIKSEGSSKSPSIEENNSDLSQNQEQYKDKSEHSDSNNTSNNNSNLPEGYEIQNIEIGVSDGEYIEVVSGLKEGDVITYMPVAASSETSMMFPGMMGGDMPGGGMPSGGMPKSGGNRDRMPDGH